MALALFIGLIVALAVIVGMAFKNSELKTERDTAQRQLIIANDSIRTMRPQVDELNKLKAGALLIEQVREQQARKGRKQ